jgi:hypothetical protein
MGLKYTSSFDSIRTQSRYNLEIYQDSYDSTPINVILAATPIVQEWQEDDPLALLHQRQLFIKKHLAKKKLSLTFAIKDLLKILGRYAVIWFFQTI